MQTVLVTGANGFIGSYLVKALLKRNFHVVATGKGASRLPSSHQMLRYLTMDFTDAQQVATVFKDVRPAVVVHAGAVSKPDECELKREYAFMQNVTGTENIINASTGSRSFMVFLSTDFVFNGDRGMYREEDVREPVNYYGRTKVEAENALIKSPLDWAIARTVLVYGDPGSERQNIITNTAKNLKEGNSLKIFDDQVRTPTYVEDLVWGIVQIVIKKAMGIYHLSGAETHTPYQMAIAVARFLGLNESLITKVTADDFPQPARRPAITGFDISKARKELGFDPVRFQEGLERTFKNQSSER
jgi:dTDP-4-dehydrorhamnose reductase